MEGAQWAIKPFSKQFTAATVGLNSGDTVDLLDTDGNPIDCNYLEVRVKNVTVAVGWVFVQPVINYAETFTNNEIYSNTGTPIVGGTLDVTKPGFGGVARNMDSNLIDQPIIIRTSGTETFNQVKINNVASLAADYELTYGVIYPVNSLETLKITTRGR